MNFWITNISNIEKNIQYERECNACKKIFQSGNKLFEHLNVNPKHKCNIHDISYTLKCKKHTDFQQSSWLNYSKYHFITISSKMEYLCEDVYVESIQITPYSQKDKQYTITDFNQNDFKC